MLITLSRSLSVSFSLLLSFLLSQPLCLILSLSYFCLFGYLVIWCALSHFLFHRLFHFLSYFLTLCVISFYLLLSLARSCSFLLSFSDSHSHKPMDLTKFQQIKANFFLCSLSLSLLFLSHAASCFISLSYTCALKLSHPLTHSFCIYREKSLVFYASVPRLVARFRGLSFL